MSTTLLLRDNHVSSAAKNFETINLILNASTRLPIFKFLPFQIFMRYSHPQFRTIKHCSRFHSNCFYFLKHLRDSPLGSVLLLEFRDVVLPIINEFLKDRNLAFGAAVFFQYKRLKCSKHFHICHTVLNLETRLRF